MTTKSLMVMINEGLCLCHQIFLEISGACQLNEITLNEVLVNMLCFFRKATFMLRMLTSVKIYELCCKLVI